jgi:hypothetical protein
MYLKYTFCKKKYPIKKSYRLYTYIYIVPNPNIKNDPCMSFTVTEAENPDPMPPLTEHASSGIQYTCFHLVINPACNICATLYNKISKR